MEDTVGNDATAQRPWFDTNTHYRFTKCFLVQCLLSRLTCLSLLVVATFLLCLTQEFTYILNFHNYVTTTSWTNNQQSSVRKRTTNTSIDIRQSGGRIAVERDFWRRITDGIYAYSAFWDNRSGNGDFVRIIVGAKIREDNLDYIKCVLSNYSSNGKYDEVPSTHQILIEHHSKLSKAAYVMCPIPSKMPPNFVALVPSAWNNTWKWKPSWMEVHRLQDIEKPSYVGVCVRPLFNYTDTFRIVEFIAYYEALGVGHFTFYNYNSVPDVHELIGYLQSSNYSLELLPWNLPPEIEDMWSLGQLANINDCIYRHMATASYIAVVDLDEFITPRQVMTIHEVMSVHEAPGDIFGSFVFRSSVFCAEYDQDTLPDTVPDFVTQSSIRRESLVYPFFVRSKYIVKPSLVVTAGIHFVYEHVPQVGRLLVPASQVLVHHYRAQLCFDVENNLEKSKIDPTSRKYLNRLMRSKALLIWKEFNRTLF